MERSEFETLRDLPGKVIRGDIRLTEKRNLSPLMTAENICVENSLGYDLRLTIKYNKETGTKNFNVDCSGVGAICRLDVDDNPHHPAGRSHKHSLRTPQCPERNLPHVQDRAQDAGSSLSTLFQRFCTMAHISHEGSLFGSESQEGGQP